MRARAVLFEFSLQAVNNYLDTGKVSEELLKGAQNPEFCELAVRQFAALLEGGMINTWPVGGSLNNLRMIQVMPTRCGSDVVSFALTAKEDPWVFRRRRDSNRESERSAKKALTAPLGDIAKGAGEKEGEVEVKKAPKRSKKKSAAS